MARVIISSGHSSANPGSVANGLREVDVAKAIAKSTLKFLRSQGVISLSVPPEMELLQRIEWINNTGYTARSNDICVEIHVNDGGKSGIEAWFEGDGGNPSQQLTEYILNAAALESKLPSQGAKSEFRHEIGSIAFIHETSPIASLIECGYIDNPSDAAFLKNAANIDLLGKGIAKGICKFLNVEYKDLPVAPPAAVPQIQSQQQQPQPVGAVNNPINSIPSQNVNAFNNNSGFGQQPPTNPMPANGGAFAPLPSREERRTMIIAMYKKILGREPNQNDINYFLNVGIREDELLKKMMDSQEHADMVKAKNEFSGLKEQFDNQKAELMQLKTAVDDQSRIIEGLNYSIMQKNSALQNMQQYISQAQSNLNNQPQAPKEEKGKSKNYKGTFLDRLFKAFSDMFE